MRQPTAPAEAYPLAWPRNYTRTPAEKRKRAAFKTPIDRTSRALHDELRMLGAKPGTVVISSNVPLRRDGEMRADRMWVEDPGVAVYFLDKRDRRTAIACDRWDNVGDNLHAIRLTVEALRGLDRWGTSQMVEAAFAGFQAIAGPPPPAPWHEVLGVPEDCPAELVEEKYTELARKHHPDRHGDPKKMAEINRAFDEFKRERGLS